jgi:hypothetical protein
MKNIENQILIDIDNLKDINKLVQIIELAAHKLDIKTISNYANDNNLSYNGVKKCRNSIDLGGVKFIVDGISKNNLPF